MIQPQNNKKLQVFHLIVACCFYVDFFMTGFIISNYEFVNNKDDIYFLDHNKYLKYK